MSTARTQKKHQKKVAADKRKSIDDLLRKQETLYRINAKKSVKPNEYEINLGWMVMVNGLGEYKGTAFAIDNFKRNPDMYYILEQNFTPEKKEDEQERGTD
tara:strand:- start:4702 stop:5004 length:303 start_codon:yes stop_codon:yes gene_type:complete